MSGGPIENHSSQLELSAAVSADAEQTEQLESVYAQLRADLNRWAEEGIAEQLIAESANSDLHTPCPSCDLPAYDDATRINEHSPVLADGHARRLASINSAAINPNSVSLTEHLQALAIGENESIQAALAANEQLSADQAVDALADEDIHCGSFWVDVGADRQWHVREFYHHASAGSAGQAELEGAARLASLRQRVLSAGSKSAFLLHGEFASGRCFYGTEDRRGVGLAWTLARAGYHVFVVDMQSLQLDPAKPGLLEGWKRRFRATDSSAVVRDSLPQTLRACAKRVYAKLSAEVLAELAAIRPLRGDINARDAEAVLQSIDELSLQLEAQAEQLRYPGVWIGHGFAAPLLAASWARLDDAEQSATRFVFFGGRRLWRGGSWYSRSLAKLLTQAWLGSVVKLLGRFPARGLQLGSNDVSAEAFSLYSNWIGSNAWLDPDDQFDYQAAFSERGTPATLHIMSETEQALVAASDVRRFANELYPSSANLIGVPAVADENVEAGLPGFTHSGMLVSPLAEQWIFEPLLEWLCDPIEQAADLAMPELAEPARPEPQSQAPLRSTNLGSLVSAPA